MWNHIWGGEVPILLFSPLPKYLAENTGFGTNRPIQAGPFFPEILRPTGGVGDEVKAGMATLKAAAPPGGEDLVEYFDTTYVNGQFRRTTAPGAPPRTVLTRTLPRFPPETWNVFQSTMMGRERTNNLTEGFNNRFRILASIKHPTIWRLIDVIRREVAADSFRVQQCVAGNSPQRQNYMWVCRGN